MKDLYTARVHVVGGRDGAARSEDGRLDIAMALPAALGGSGAGANPEQLFAAGFAGCFASSLKHVANQRKLDLGALTIDAAVTLALRGDGGYGLKATLDIRASALNDEALTALIDDAKRVCAYTHATQGNVETDYRVAPA
ncbi:MAG: Ohr family peroxiredoxin [Alphaproteobacteria bacterium]|nr:Ohr family peroxiredoxin [Alphaproteobacteria bacterium]